MRFRLMFAATLVAAGGIAAATAIPAAAATAALPAHLTSVQAQPKSTSLVASAQWTNGGKTLSIMPTLLARTYGESAAAPMMNDALSIAGKRSYSSAVYDSLLEQLECHLFLMVKVPYNLDTWRPSVPWITELAKLCNP
jgi:FtsP/CotA-like multicopper oxidase with cupredoxin domain